MINKRLESIFIERPEFLLALSLSAPSGRTMTDDRAITLTFENDDVIVRTRHPNAKTRSLKLACTKSTVSAAVLMHHILTERGPEFAPILLEKAIRFATESAEHDLDQSPLREFNAGRLHGFTSQSAQFFKGLNVSQQDYETAARKTTEALQFLEDEGLAIDPGFTPEFMVLLGVVPMHFSVRTPKGDRIYREIRVNAPLWTLEIERGRQKEKNFTNVEFKFRGIDLVRGALTAMAAQYLDTEENERKSKGKRVVPRRGQPDLDKE